MYAINRSIEDWVTPSQNDLNMSPSISKGLLGPLYNWKRLAKLWQQSIKYLNFASVSFGKPSSRVIDIIIPLCERETKNKVLSAMKHGLPSYTVAQSLASNRFNSVGILVSELHGS